MVWVDTTDTGTFDSAVSFALGCLVRAVADFAEGNFPLAPGSVQATCEGNTLALATVLGTLGTFKCLGGFTAVGCCKHLNFSRLND